MNTLYVAPQIELINFEFADVLTTSCGGLSDDFFLDAPKKVTSLITLSPTDSITCS